MTKIHQKVPIAMKLWRGKSKIEGRKMKRLKLKNSGIRRWSKSPVTVNEIQSKKSGNEGKSNSCCFDLRKNWIFKIRQNEVGQINLWKLVVKSLEGDQIEENPCHQPFLCRETMRICFLANFGQCRRIRAQSKTSGVAQNRRTEGPLAGAEDVDQDPRLAGGGNVYES